MLTKVDYSTQNRDAMLIAMPLAFCLWCHPDQTLRGALSSDAPFLVWNQTHCYMASGGMPETILWHNVSLTP